MSNPSLPTSSTPFIGRETELTLIHRWLVDPSHRLISLVGLGGIGKTRLAIEAAKQNRDYFPDGVFFVRLQPLELPELILPTIAEAARMASLPGTNLQQQLVGFLDGKRRLLVLDSFEHLLPGVDAVIDLLQSSSDVRFLITSREKLNIQDETVLHIGPLSYPEQECEDAERYDAVTLLLTLLHRLEPEMLITPDVLADAILICRQVQGLPLAIELAIGWADTLSLQEITQEITRSFDFLETRRRDSSERHHSIRAVLDPSLQTLSDADRAVLEGLCLFRSSFTREAAEAVTGATSHSLGRLVSKSLVRHRPSGRYDIHELVRQYGEARLNGMSGRREVAQECYCAYYANFLEAQWREMKSAMRNTPFERIDSELANSMIAFQSMSENGRTEQIWQSMDALWNYLTIRYKLTEGALLFGKSVEALRASQHKALIGSLLIRQACFLAGLGSLDEAKRLAKEGLTLLECHQDEVMADTFVVAYLCLVLVHWFADEPQQLQEAACRGLEYSIKNDHPFGIRSTMCFAANAELKLGNYIQAREMGHRCYDLAVDQGDLWIQGLTAIIVLAEVAYAQGKYSEARRWCQTTQRCLEDLSQPYSLALTSHRLTTCSVALQDFTEAQNYLNTCMQLLDESGLAWQIPPILLDMARLLAEQHMMEQAVMILSLVLRHSACRKTTHDEATRLLDQLESAVPADHFAVAWEYGHAQQSAHVLETLAFVYRDGTMQPSHASDLSIREQEVLRLIVDGLSNAEIAQRLCLSISTVKVHTRHIYGKLGVNSRIQAAFRAQELGFL